MLRRFAVRGFKSLRDIDIEMPPFSVFLGPNAAGKSNLLDAIQAFSRIGSSRTLGEAMNGDLRGFPIEAFSFPAGGFEELLSSPTAHFDFEAELTTGKRRGQRYRYGVSVEINCRSGALSARRESLVPLTAGGSPKRSPVIETADDAVVVRQRGRGRPRKEPLDRPFAALSDPRFTDPDHEPVRSVRDELVGWRTYHLDPRVAMRSGWPPLDVRDIGVYGQHLAPYLYRLRHEHPKRYAAVRRALRVLVPDIEELEVRVNHAHGKLELWIRQDGISFSSRVVSEGTLRVLALAILAVDPWAGSLVAFEEPEVGVHPRRVELIADLLYSLARERKRQVVVATHSPLFCDAVLKKARENDRNIGLFAVGRKERATCIRRLDLSGPLFNDPGIRDAMSSDDAVFESLFAHGFLDN